jgi:GT2 family glycosyltransferase
VNSANRDIAAEAKLGGGVSVSVLIINFNGVALLPACLESLKKAVRPGVEVVVVDNASSDGSLEMLRQHEWVKVVRSETNSGFAGGNNLGLKYCSGQYVLLLNNDTIAPPGFLEPLCKYLDQHPQVGIVQGKMVLPRFGNTLDVCGSFLTAVGFPYHYGYFKPDGPKYQRSYPVFSGKGACLMFRRELIPKIGGFLFDPDFFCYYEESDLCHRTWLAGYEVHFVPSPPIQHLMGGTAGDAHSAFVLRHYLRNMAFSLASNLSFASRLRVLPLFFGMLTVGMMGALFTGRLKQSGAHWGALCHCISNRKKINSRRKLIRDIRKRTDREIFAKVLRNPGLAYFFKTFRGEIGKFVDRDLK